MPTYDYACSACGHRFERFESIHDDKVKACPKCGKKKSKRMMGTGAGLIFKGSGFYTTDYKGGGRKDKESKESKESGTAAKEPEKKSGGKEKDKKEDKEPKK